MYTNVRSRISKHGFSSAIRLYVFRTVRTMLILKCNYNGNYLIDIQFFFILLSSVLITSRPLHKPYVSGYISYPLMYTLHLCGYLSKCPFPQLGLFPSNLGELTRIHPFWPGPSPLSSSVVWTLKPITPTSLIWTCHFSWLVGQAVLNVTEAR